MGDPRRLSIAGPELRTIASSALTPGQRAAILALCERAYGEDLRPLFDQYRHAVHVLACEGDAVAGHAMWVTRQLQAGTGPMMPTAYVEALAVEPSRQRRGVGMAIMRQLVTSFEGVVLGALCPTDQAIELYRRLGWIPWRGPLSVRRGNENVPTPDEFVMVLPLPQTPPLDFSAPLSVEWREGEEW